MSTETFLKLDEHNPSGRIYPKAVVEEALAALYRRGDTLFGTLGVSADPISPFQTPIADYAYVVENPRIEKQALVAEVRILDTPAGRALRELLESQVKIRFATVGVVRTNADRLVNYFNLVGTVAIQEISDKVE
jgi:hypothetical protein